VTDALAQALVEHAYLEGDFLLRSGKRSRYYLDKYRFETRPDLLRPLGERIAATVAEHAPDATRLAGPELGAVAACPSSSFGRRRRNTAPRNGSRVPTRRANAFA
jgi:orotate phosphoribosyltransferase